MRWPKYWSFSFADNMIEDDDVADGWVKAHEVEELINGKED